MPMRSLELHLPAAPTAPAEARAVVEAIGSDLPEPVLVDAKLLVTEVVANAINHASRGMQAVIIRIRRNHFIRVEVLKPSRYFKIQMGTGSFLAGTNSSNSNNYDLC